MNMMCDLVHNQNKFVAKSFVAQNASNFWEIYEWKNRGGNDVYHFRKSWMSFCAVEFVFLIHSFSAESEWKPKTSLNVAPNASICSYCGMLSIDDWYKILNISCTGRNIWVVRNKQFCYDRTLRSLELMREFILKNSCSPSLRNGFMNVLECI